MEQKKILAVQGGGRANGNTAQLVKHFVRGAEEAGHQVEVISLIKNEVKGCLGCNACRYGKPCIQKDAFNELVPKSRRRIASSLLLHCISGHSRPESKHLSNGFTVLRRKIPTLRLGDMRSIR